MPCVEKVEVSKTKLLKVKIWNLIAVFILDVLDILSIPSIFYFNV